MQIRFIISLILYALLIAVGVWSICWYMYRRREQQVLREQSLYLIYLHLYPGNLFNILNAIKHAILVEDLQAAHYLTQFARWIQLIISHSKVPFVRFEEAMKLVKLFAQLYAVRQPNAFQIEVENWESTNRDEDFPSMILQLLLQYAIHYGMYRMNGCSHIQLSTDNKNNKCYFLIRLSGNMLTPYSKDRDKEINQIPGVVLKRLEALKKLHHIDFDLDIRLPSGSNPKLGIELMVETHRNRFIYAKKITSGTF